MAIRNKFANLTYQEQKIILMIILPIMAFLMVSMVLAIFIFYKSKTEKKINGETYQYFLDQFTEYGDGIKLIPGDSHSVVMDGKTERTADPSPIYLKGEDTMVIPMDTCFMDVSETSEWRLEAGAILDCSGNDIKLTRGDKVNYITGGFLHDGGRTYIFLDAVSLEVDGITYELPPMSFVSREANMFRVYSYGSDEVIVPPSAGNEIVARNNKKGYSIDIKSNVYYSINGERRLLTASPNVLVDFY